MAWPLLLVDGGDATVQRRLSTTADQWKRGSFKAVTFTNLQFFLLRPVFHSLYFIAYKLPSGVVVVRVGRVRLILGHGVRGKCERVREKEWQ